MKRASVAWFWKYSYSEPCRSLVPDLETILTMPPAARPYSAPKLLFTTRNSWTDSCGGVDRCTPEIVLTKSAPSTVTVLLNDRMPANEICEVSKSVKVVPRLVRLVATPGVSNAKSVNNRPLMGSDSICCVATTWLISVLVGSITGVSVVTTTFSFPEATFSVTSMVAVCPTVSSIPVSVDFANPVASVVNSYRPGGTLASTYSPFSLDTVLYVRLVSVFRSVTDAFATEPPLASRTAPTCAVVGLAQVPRISVARTVKNHERRPMIHPSRKIIRTIHLDL